MISLKTFNLEEDLLDAFAILLTIITVRDVAFVRLNLFDFHSGSKNVKLDTFYYRLKVAVRDGKYVRDIFLLIKRQFMCGIHIKKVSLILNVTISNIKDVAFMQMDAIILSKCRRNNFSILIFTHNIDER